MSFGSFGARRGVLSIVILISALEGGCGGSGAAGPAPDDPIPVETEPDRDARVDAGLEMPAADGGEPDAGFSREPDAGFAAALRPGEWEAMGFDQREQFMREVVVPALRPGFQALDAERFAGFGCRTCHGSGARAGDFAMPSPDLPAMNSPAFTEPDESNRPMTDFMRNTVRPTMAELLGKQGPPAALRCSTCHASE